jgi:hypothetical protein
MPEPPRIDFLDQKAHIPKHVVYRSFATETIILNLETGQYHGLNATAAAMLETINSAASLSEAVAVVAAQYGQPLATVAADLRELCQGLLDRGLLELDRSPA